MLTLKYICEHCGVEVMMFVTPTCELVYNAEPVPYCYSANPNAELITSRGKKFYCELVEDPMEAHGFAHKKHTCFEESPWQIINRFTMPIGDWSADGHGQCDNYTIVTNNTLEEIREAHFSLPIKIEELCNRKNSLTAAQFMKIKRYLSFKTVVAVEDGATGNGTYAISTYTMAMIWTDLLNRTKAVTVTLLPEDQSDMIPFYGVDEKGRHISHVGYGLFM